MSASQKLFGKIILDANRQNKVKLSPTGEIAQSCWLEIPIHYPNVKLHEFVIIPDHMHGILEIKQQADLESNNQRIPQVNKYQKIIPKSIGSILRGYKIGVTKWFRDQCMKEDWILIDRQEIVLWQRNYYEHIIRNQFEYFVFSNYIRNNPKNWKGKIEEI